MALPLILRRSAAIQGLPNLFKNSNIIVANARCFSQFVQNNKCSTANNENKMHLILANTSLTKRNMSATGDHSKLWTIEKAVSVSMLAIVPAAILVPNPVLDNLFAVATVMHFHWGLEACVMDYIRPIIFGPAIPKISLGLLYLVSATTLGGLIYYNFNDIGIGRTIKKLWEIKK